MKLSDLLVSFNHENEFGIKHIIQLTESDIYSSIGSAIFALIPRLIFLNSYQDLSSLNESIEDLTFYKHILNPDYQKLSKNYPELAEDLKLYFHLMKLVLNDKSSSKEAYNWLSFYFNDPAHIKLFNNAIRAILASMTDPEKKHLIQKYLTNSDPSEDLVNLLTVIAENFHVAVYFFDIENNRNSAIKPKKIGTYPKIFLIRNNGFSIGIHKEEIKVTNFEKTSRVLELFLTYYKLRHNLVRTRLPFKHKNTESVDSTSTGSEIDIIEIIEKLVQNLLRKKIFLNENRELLEKIAKLYDSNLVPNIREYLDQSVQLDCSACSEKFLRGRKSILKKCDCIICDNCLKSLNNCPECSTMFF